MPKQIRREYPIYLAPDILGRYVGDTPEIIDERNQEKKLDPKNLNDKIFIYERQVKGWFLNPAESLLNSADFVTLMICMSYFEGVEQFKCGEESKKKSRQFFIESIKKLYPDKFSDENIGILYDEARCGLFHDGMSRKMVIINNSFEESIEFTNNDIKINVSKLLADIKEDFENFLQLLRSDNTASDKFNKMYSLL